MKSHKPSISTSSAPDSHESPSGTPHTTKQALVALEPHRISTRERIDAIRAGEISTEEPESRVESAYVSEIYALCSLFTEEIWQKIQAWVRQYPDRLRNRDGSHYTLIDFTEDNAPQFALYHHTADLYHGMIEELSAERCGRLLHLDGQEWDAKDRAFRRYINLLQSNPMYSTPIEHLLAGSNTALRFMWGIINVIPELFETHFGHRPSYEEAQTIAHNCLPLLMTIAQTHVDILVDLDRLVTDPAFTMRFNPAAFTFVEMANGGLKLEIRPDRLRQLEKPTSQRGHYVIGCPATHARGEKRNMIPEMYDWLIGVNRRFNEFRDRQRGVHLR